MVLRSSVLFALVFSFCTVCFIYPYHRLVSVLFSTVLILATVLLLGSETSSNQFARESYPSETDWIAEPTPEIKGTVFFQTPLIVPPPTIENTQLEKELQSLDEKNTTPKLRRSASFTMPRANYLELDLWLGDDDDEQFWLAEESTVGLVSQLVSAKRDSSAENLEKAPSLTAEQVSQLADAFIAGFHERIRLERQKSDERAWEILQMQQSYDIELYQAMLDRSVG